MTFAELFAALSAAIRTDHPADVARAEEALNTYIDARVSSRKPQIINQQPPKIRSAKLAVSDFECAAIGALAISPSAVP
jgi:hypothetical protein